MHEGKINMSSEKKPMIDFSEYEVVDVLDEEEQAIHNALLAGEYESHNDPETINYYGEIFRNAAKQRKAISLRIPTNDYFAIRTKAKNLGLPYQALINSIIHRYISDDGAENYFNHKIVKKVG